MNAAPIFIGPTDHQAIIEKAQEQIELLSFDLYEGSDAEGEVTVELQKENHTVYIDLDITRRCSHYSSRTYFDPEEVEYKDTAFVTNVDAFDNDDNQMRVYGLEIGYLELS